MTIGKIVKRISFGFIFAILAIGVLPYLFAYSFSELFGISELTTAPILLLQRIFKDGSGNHDIPNSEGTIEE